MTLIVGGRSEMHALVRPWTKRDCEAYLLTFTADQDAVAQWDQDGEEVGRGVAEFVELLDGASVAVG